MAQAPCKGLSGNHTGFREWIDATETREHIEYLRSRGVSMTAIAMELGLTPQAVSYIRTTSRWVRRGVAEGILSLTPKLALNPQADEDKPRPTTKRGHSMSGARVPKVFAVRRIRALQCMGYTMDYLCERVGFNLWNLLQEGPRGSRTTKRRHDAVVAMYEELWNIPGPSHSARVRAFAKGYHPPLAWDDIDNIACVPVRTPRAQRPRSRHIELREEKRAKRAVERRNR
jgi:hypothetical protein